MKRVIRLPHRRAKLLENALEVLAYTDWRKVEGFNLVYDVEEIIDKIYSDMPYDMIRISLSDNNMLKPRGVDIWEESNEQSHF